MAIKIQIASKEALERLIGGDSEVEVEVRESIVQNFTKTHLKSLVKSITDEGWGKFIRSEIFEKSKNYPYQEVLKEEHKTKMRGEILLKLEQEIYKLVENTYKSLDVENRITKMIEQKAQNLADIFLSQNIEKRVEERANQIIKERLGLS